MICSGAEGWAHFKDGETEAQTQQGVRQLGTIWFLSTAPGLPPALLPPSAPTPARASLSLKTESTDWRGFRKSLSCGEACILMLLRAS